MDNASNCDATAEHLVTLIDGFRGKLSRSRCFPHTVNLIAKAFISFFFRQPKRKKIIATGQHTRKRGPAVVAGTSSVTATMTDTTEVEVEQLTADEEHLAADMLEPQSGDGEIDEAKDAHDKEVVSAVHRDALNTGKEMGLFITSTEQREALGLFPKVAGLAKRLHDNANLQAAFERIVAIEGGGPSQKKTLDRRVPTRWNSDFACLKTHMLFEKEIKLFTSQEANGLQIYALTVTQWKLAKQLIPVLEIFDDLTNRFSQAEVPLVHEVIPMLERLEHMMVEVSRDTELSAIVRVAALAALQVIGKYYALTDDNEVYRIAIIMCPDKKMEWFTKNSDWREEDKLEARRIVTQRWLETYAPTAADILSTQSLSRPPARKRSKYDINDSDDESLHNAPSLDSLESYINSPRVSRPEIIGIGGVLKYWENARATRPRLAQMALDFLSAPASSVDAERAFSCGRLQVNHLQHGISSQAFKAQMAIGSWYKTPFLDDTIATRILSESMKRGKKGKGKAQQDAGSHVVELDSD